MSKHTFTYLYLQEGKRQPHHFKAVCSCGWTYDFDSTTSGEAFHIEHSHKLDVLLELVEGLVVRIGEPRSEAAGGKR